MAEWHTSKSMQVIFIFIFILILIFSSLLFSAL